MDGSDAYIKNDSFKVKHYSSFSSDSRYCNGAIPVCAFTNLPKKEGLGKSKKSAISFMLKVECFSLNLIS